MIRYLIIFIESDLKLYLTKYIISRPKSTAAKDRRFKVTHLYIVLSVKSF